MIGITVTAEAYAAIKATLPDDTQTWPTDLGDVVICLDQAMVDRLAAMRGPGESYSDVDGDHAPNMGADDAMRHHQVLTRAPVDYGPRSGNARPSDWRTSTTVQSGPKARHTLRSPFGPCRPLPSLSSGSCSRRRR
jgi:hypothetical protein